jgi:hypothetical protein
MNHDWARRQAEHRELAQRAHEYRASVARRSIERAVCEGAAKDEAMKRTIQRALATVLRDGLHAMPDAFAGTQLTEATVNSWAERWAAEIV